MYQNGPSHELKGEKHRRNRTDRRRTFFRLLRAILNPTHLPETQPENFMYVTQEAGSPLKLSDFGLAAPFRPGTKLTERCGTIYYVAPEARSRGRGGEDGRLNTPLITAWICFESCSAVAPAHDAPRHRSQVISMSYGPEADLWSAGVLVWRQRFQHAFRWLEGEECPREKDAFSVGGFSAAWLPNRVLHDVRPHRRHISSSRASSRSWIGKMTDQ